MDKTAGNRTPTIYIVSDGRGATCSQLVKAALVQFENHPTELVRRSHVLTPEAVEAIVAEAAADEATVFFTLASEETRRAMQSECARHLVPSVDLLGPAFSALHDLFKDSPQFKPGLLYESDREHFDRVNAIDYTLKHDDGLRPQELHQAHVILVGVSRASKSSTCFYLAYQGVRAANVPLVPGIPPPPELLTLDREMVIGLRINVMRLRTIRESRILTMRMGADDKYVDKREIAREVREANRLMDTHGWRSLDISYMAIEEIAKTVRQMRGLPRLRAR